MGAAVVTMDLITGLMIQIIIILKTKLYMDLGGQGEIYMDLSRL